MMEKVLIVKHKNKDKLASFIQTLYAVAKDQDIKVEAMRVIKDKLK